MSQTLHKVCSELCPTRWERDWRLEKGRRSTEMPMYLMPHLRRTFPTSSIKGFYILSSSILLLFPRESTAFQLVLLQRSQREKKKTKNTTTHGSIGRQLQCITLQWPTLWLWVNEGRFFVGGVWVGGGVRLHLILKSSAIKAHKLQALKSFCAALTSSTSGFMIFADSFFIYIPK